MDRDATFCESFRTMLKDEGIEPTRLPPRSPNLNAYVERFFRSLKSECLERMIFFGENSLRNAVREFLSHYQYAPILQRRGLASLGVIQWVIELGRFEILAARLAETCRWNDASNWQLCRRRC